MTAAQSVVAEQLVILEVNDLSTYFLIATSRVNVVPALDVSIRAQPKNLMKYLQEQ